MAVRGRCHGGVNPRGNRLNGAQGRGVAGSRMDRRCVLVYRLDLVRESRDHNPRALSNTFAGIAPSNAPAFIASQLCGALLGLMLAKWLQIGPNRSRGWTRPKSKPERPKKGGLAESLDLTPSFSPSRPARGNSVLASALRAALTAALRWPASGSGNPARESNGERSCRIIIFLP
jgi:hypothetical protein